MIAGYFQNPALLAGLGLVALPILIHLLNRFRYRRVRWAAMQFLLESQQRNRRRVLLEQLFLLALRCLLVILAVLLVARPQADAELAAWLSNRQTEHVVVLDDSYSMGARHGGTTAFATAVEAIASLVRTLADRPGQHLFTLMRTSRADVPELESVRLDRAGAFSIAGRLADWQPTLTSSGPSMLNKLADRFSANGSAHRSLYFLSDYRRCDWQTPEPASAPGGTSAVNRELLELLRRAAAAGTRITLIDAAPATTPNLTLESATGELGIAAAGVPFPLSARVRNHSPHPVERLNVTARVDGRLLPARTLERLEPGAAGRVEFELVFDDPGVHELAVELPEDALDADNRRYVAVDLPERIEVLLIDGGRERTDSRFVALALAPGGSIRTGFLPTVRGPEALTAADFAPVRAVFLLNVPRLERPAVDALETYVEAGGGLAVFLGDQVDAQQYNQTLCAPESGLFPVALEAPWEARPGVVVGPDLRPEAHRIFRVFEGERNPFLDTVRVFRMFRVADEKLRGTTKVILRWRGGWPVALESRHGRGRALLILTTAGPDWNTWARNPSFVVAMLEMARYLCEPGGHIDTGQVGEPWEVDLSAAHRTTATLRAPSPDGMRSNTTIEALLQGDGRRRFVARTERPGVYELAALRADGSTQLFVKAHNVDPAEGDLTKITTDELAAWLAGIDYRYLSADELDDLDRPGGFDPRDGLILALVALLIVEQYWSCRLGYHMR